MKLPQLSTIGDIFPKLRTRPDKVTGKGRPYQVAQIEVTSRCNTGCVFCPHDALSAHWVEGDLSLDLYREKIAPHLDLFELIYLQGWGESMLHPNLWDMLKMAQQKGCRTGFTTNGAWLDGDQNRSLVTEGVNLISVSFAGTCTPMHESLRTNSDFTKLCQNFESLANLKKQKGTHDPWLELHFLMTRGNISEFPSLIELAASLGADEIVATNLTYSPSLTLDRLHVFGEEPLPEDMAMIEQAKKNAERLHIPLRVYPLRTEANTLVCDADPINTIYINHQGDVTPCVYLGLTVQGTIPRFYQGEAHPFDPVTFGNVSTGLVQRLHSRERKEFTSVFERRRASNTPLALFTYMAGQSSEEELPRPPTACRHCYKMLGV